MIALETIRDTLHPELQSKFNLLNSKIGKTRIIFTFKSEEQAICGAAAVTEFCKQKHLPARTIPADDGPMVFLYPEDLYE